MRRGFFDIGSYGFRVEWVEWFRMNMEEVDG